MRDTHYPSDFSEKRLASKDQVEKSRKIWTIVKGPRVTRPPQSSNSTNNNSGMILQNHDASNISELLSRNSRNKSNRAELIKQLKEKAAAEEERKKLLYQVRTINR
jgi:hypothetical protein